MNPLGANLAIFANKICNKLHFGSIFEKYCLREITRNNSAGVHWVNMLAEQDGLRQIKDPYQTSPYCIRQYCNHRFNLLGSGWVCLNKAQDAPAGSELPAYQKIDWQIDYKSGYRFDSRQSSRAIMRSALPKGVDIKVPWELARMYHLPKLALAAYTKTDADTFISEFANEVIDFHESNTVGYGVNWTCAMEVGIRACNILLAYDIFTSRNPGFAEDADFRAFLASMMLEHGRFILLNLEKAYGGRSSGNHYLADLCGLLFISSYIKTKETETWKKYAIKELLSEIDAQFLADGGSAEGSTAYHRLAAEITAYSVGLMRRNNAAIPLPIQNKLLKIAEFMQITSNEEGEIIQIGDNDSGHLFRLTERERRQASKNPDDCPQNNAPDEWGDAPRLELDELWAGRTADLLLSLFQDMPNETIETAVLQSIANGKKFAMPLQKPVKNKQPACMHSEQHQTYKYRHVNQLQLIHPINVDLLQVRIFEEFGLAVFQEKGFLLYARLPQKREPKLTSHLHDDVLHWECYQGKAISSRDPGSYVYSADIEERNRYRSRAAHNVPIHQAAFLQFSGLWNCKTAYCGYIESFSKESISMIVRAEKMVHRRTITIRNTCIDVVDESNQLFVCSNPTEVKFSHGYGLRNEKTALISSANKISLRSKK